MLLKIFFYSNPIDYSSNKSQTGETEQRIKSEQTQETKTISKKGRQRPQRHKKQKSNYTSS